MPLSAKPTVQEEDTFMKALLSGLDETFFSAVPSSPPATPKPNIQKKQHGSKPAATLKDVKSQSMNPENTSRRVIDVQDVDVDALCDGVVDLEDWDMDNDIDGDMEATVSQDSCPPPLIRETSTRCEVLQVISFDYSEKRLLVKVHPGTEKREVILKDDWVHSDIFIGNTINVLGQFEPVSSSTTSTSTFIPASSITLTRHLNTLILHPDLLVSATTIANAASCTRKPLISLMLASNAPEVAYPTPEGVTPKRRIGEAVVWGNFLHTIFQEALDSSFKKSGITNSSPWSKASINDRISEVIHSPFGLGELVKLDVGIEKTKEELRSRATGVEEFGIRWVGPKIKPSGQLTELGGDDGAHDSMKLAITALHDVEEDIWSPTWGLKGKLDASLQVLLEEPKTAPGETQSTLPHIQSYTMPLEIKTGRLVTGLEHRAQTLLYAILMTDRYGVRVPSGLLYYTQASSLIRVPVTRNELRGLIMARNELAGYLMRKRVTQRQSTEEIHAPAPELSQKEDTALSYNFCSESHKQSPTQTILPPPLDDEYKCIKCYAVDGCMLYRMAVEKLPPPTNPQLSLKTSHLTESQLDFFKTWEALVSMEEQDIVRFRKELWTLTAEEREKRGRCWREMVVLGEGKYERVDQKSKDEETREESRTKFVYRFVRASAAKLPSIPSSAEATSLLTGTISPGDAITISVEPDLLAIIRGYVLALEPDVVTIGFERVVDLAAVVRRTNRTIPGSGSSLPPASEEVVCRIDKDEFGSGLGRIRDNLARLFYPQPSGDTKRLSLVVDLAPPRFDDTTTYEDSGSLLPEHLNPNQRGAILKVLRAKDYALILGMPGTGKTSTIKELVDVLVRRGKTVLVVAYTHSAVDNILAKLAVGLEERERHGEEGYGILRLGSIDKVHPDVKKYTLAARPRPTTIEQLEHQILDPPVVATTCLSVDHPLFARRYFDYCIVDEASQVTLPTCLGPLRYADKFVLVGDHFQLPPLVRSQDARAGGLDISLFKRLVDAHPKAVVDLVYQYRMNADIMLLSNKLIYSDRLRCGSRDVAGRSLVLPRKSESVGIHGERCRAEGGCWMEKILDESCKAVFVDTDLVAGHESRVGDLIQNDIEAKLVCQTTEALLKCGIQQTQIGIISLYRQQIKLLSHLLHCHKGIELLTADRSQGRDKECIIISMVKSNGSGQIGDLLKDWRRINVSFTRARSKLIIFGSRKTLRTAPVLAEFFDLMESKGWILALTPGAETMHEKPSSTREANMQVSAWGNMGISTGPTTDTVGASKRRVTDDGKENQTSIIQHKAKRAKVSQGILRGRPMLQDIVNDVSK